MRWIGLFFWLVMCFAVAGISGWWTTPEIPVWYRRLVRPSIAPPDWVFAPVWTTLYALMAIAAWRASQAPDSSLRTIGLILFVVQLGLNFAWSYIFFRKHAIGAALVEVAFLWAAIGTTMVAFSHVAPVAAWLMSPYLAWVSFASILNAAIWRLNPAPIRANHSTFRG